MSVEKITSEDKVKSQEAQITDKQSTQQKESQVLEQGNNAAEQAKAEAANQVQDAKAKLDKINKEIGKIPQTIEEKLDEAIKALEKAMGWSPEIKKVKIKKPDGTEIEVPDFDPNKILSDLSKVLNPVMTSLGPVESVAGKVPVIGDLTGLLTTLGTDKTGEDAISKEELLSMVPNAPDIPPTIYKKIGRLMQLISQFIQELPIILIDVIFQMLAAIYDMFDQIVGIIGVPPAIFPFSLIKSLTPLPSKIKTLIQQMPSQADTLVTEKIKQKFQYAMALSVPKPNLSAPSISTANHLSTAQNNSTENVTEENKTETQVTQSQLPPVESKIPETPSVSAIEPKPPIVKPEPTNSFFDISIETSGCDLKHTKFYALNKSSKKTLGQAIAEYVSDVPNIKKISDNHYEFNSLIKKMTRNQALTYFGSLFKIPWTEEINTYCEGQKICIIRNFTINVSNDKVNVKYIQHVYSVTTDEDGEEQLSDEEFSLPDGFLDV